MLWLALRKIRSRKAGARRDAVKELARSNDSRAKQALTEALRDRDEGVRLEAVKVLALTAGQWAINPLISTLNDPNEGVSVEGAKALDILGWAPANSYDRALHAIRLGRYDEAAREGQVAIPLLLAELRRTNPQILRSSMQSDGIIAALGNLRGDSAVNSLVAGLLDPSETVRIAAAKALGDIGSPRAVEALIGALEDTTDIFRNVHVAEALGKIGDKRAVAPLLEMFTRCRSFDVDIQSTIAEAVTRLGEVSVVERLIPQLAESHDERPREILRKIGKGAVPSLTRALKDDKRVIREEVTALLAEISMLDQ